MWDAGYTHHLGVDFSEPVIKEMVEKNALVRPGLRFEVMDVTAMSLDASSVHAVLDKGLLDAMIADGDEAALAGVQKFVAELLRVLKPGGRYLLVTLAQPHVLDTILRSFGEPESGCTLEVAVLSAAAEGSKLAPFLFTITKEPPAAGGHLMIREGGASAPATNVRYAQDWDGIRSFVQDAQWTHQSHSQLQELRPGNYFTFQLWGASDTGAGGAAKGTKATAAPGAGEVESGKAEVGDNTEGDEITIPGVAVKLTKPNTTLFHSLCRGPGGSNIYFDHFRIGAFNQCGNINFGIWGLPGFSS